MISGMMGKLQWEVFVLLQNDPKPKLSPVPVLRCTSPDCKAWVREEMATGKDMSCPLCKGAMIRSFKHLPELITKIKRQKKKDGNESITH